MLTINETGRFSSFFRSRKNEYARSTSSVSLMASAAMIASMSLMSGAQAQLVIGNQNTGTPPAAVQIVVSDPVSVTITDTNPNSNALEVQMPNGFIANTPLLYVTGNSTTRSNVAVADVVGAGSTMTLGGVGFGGTVVVTNNSPGGGSAVGAFNLGVMTVSNTTAISPVNLGGASFFTQCTNGSPSCATTQIIFGANNVAQIRGSGWGVLSGPGATQALGGSQIVPLFIGEANSHLVGAYGGGILNVAPNTLLTNSVNNDNVSGVWSSSGGISNLASGTTINLGNASNLNGVVADSNSAAAGQRSVVNGANINVNLNGAGSKGAYAWRGGLVNLTGGVINAVGVNTTGGLAQAANPGGQSSTLQANGTVFTANGNGAIALAMMDSGQLSITGGSASALGNGTTGLFSSNTTSVANNAALSNLAVSSPNGASIHVNGGPATISMTNVQMTTNNGTWLMTDSGASASILNLTAAASTMSGAALTAGGNTANVSLSNGTRWTMSGTSNVTSLTNDSSTIIYSAPAGDPSQLASYKTLTANNYTGVNGTLVLNTYLGTDGAPSDRLVINGGTATGSTALIINNVSGPGLVTYRDGIMVVQALNGAVTGSGAGDQTTFHLGSRVAAGAYEYHLYYGGNAETGGNPDDQNWYLRNTIANPVDPDGPPVPDVRPEVPTSMVIPPLAIEYGYAMLGTMHERIGEAWTNPGPVYEDRTVWCKDASKNFKCTVRVPVAGGAGKDETRWARSGWARLIGDRGIHDPDNFLRNGPNYNYTFGGIQAGLDIYAREQADGTLDKAGVYIGYGQITSNVMGAFGGKAGSVDMDAYTLAGYWNHVSPNGWYTDAIVQGTWYTTDAKSIYGQHLKPDGFGVVASLEGGYSFKLGSGWTLDPQAQIVYQNVSFDNARDAYGFVRFDDGDSLRGRLGVRLTRTWNTADQAKPRLITAWLRGNIWHEFMGKTKTSWGSIDGYNMVPFYSSLGGTWGEIGFGGTAQLTETVNLFAAGAYQHSLDGKGYEGWNGRLGATVKW